ncbi:uncharacterized protein LOC108911260 [Anoplophora glabripennis]|uniref:uncharacterized protein LOC108911260 n=1 Tax=Anoplophora glabripennis TaxID=217634 RepID=UPI0008748705|nr:uncharacterized protein LOC108911260 [Anoplophora glabripennis]
MNKVVFAFVCVAILQIASALECFSCKGPTCETETKTWDKKTCGTSGVSLPANAQHACLKLSYKDRTTQKMMVERGCTIANLKDGKLSHNCQNAGDQPVCPVCQTDLCNSAKSISFSFVALCGVVLAIAAPKLM